MRRFQGILGVFLIVVVVLGTLLPMLSISADSGTPKDKKVVAEQLPPGWERVNQHTIQKLGKIREKPGKGKVAVYETEISQIPSTMPDLKTKIIPEWRNGKAIDGVQFFLSGTNLFDARVTGTRVSVEYEDKMVAWDPQILIGGTILGLKSGPELIKDPLNKNYEYNTVRWTYTLKSVTVTRYLRQIEGMLQEFYVLNKDPGNTFQIVERLQREEGFTGQFAVPYAYDSNQKDIPIQVTPGGKAIDKFDLRNPSIKYPICLDPSLSFSSMSYYSGLSKIDASYSTARTATSGTIGTTSEEPIGQCYHYSTTEDDYRIWRSMFFFDTGPGIPDNANILTAELSIRARIDFSSWLGPGFNVQIQSGAPTYPHTPPVAGDYYHANYSGNGGSISTGGMSNEQYFQISLNSAGISWIDKIGYTKFMLRSSRDISGTTPTGSEFLKLYNYYMGSGWAPSLVVNYEVPVVNPTVSTDTATDISETGAKLGGTLTSDGGAACSVRSEYGLTASYGATTSWLSGYTTGQTWSQGIPGLQPGTIYYHTARASNSAGSSTSDGKTFLTKPYAPTAFTATPGDTQNTLSWTKGTGSVRTKIRFSTSGYPSTITSGDPCYFDTGSSYVHPSLTNGTTYYYSAWGETTSGTYQQYSTTKITTTGIPTYSGVPLVQTNAVTPVGTTTATYNGFLSSLGGTSTVDCTFQHKWGAGSWETIAPAPETKTTTGGYSISVTGLPAATLISVRAKATSTNGTGYGDTVTFTTGQPSAPTITTNPAQGEQKTSASIWLTVTSDGGALPVTVWFEWGTSTAYGHETDTDIAAQGDQRYVVLSGLDPSTTYHFRGVGENSAGRSYGLDRTFNTTTPEAPTVRTDSATDLGASAARLHGTLLTDGGVATKTRFQISVTGNWTGEETTYGWMDGYTAGQSFEYWADNLAIGQKYYFRAQAQNAGGEANGSTLTFTTVFTAPTNFQAIPLSSTSIKLTWTSTSDKTLVRVKVGSFPADRLDGEQVYFGSGSAKIHDGLVPGLTYFYRAWSWREGDIYSTAYAEDAVSTASGALPGAPVTLDIKITKPGEPSWMWQTPSSGKIQTWPGVGLVDSIGSEMGMDPGTLWGFVAGIILSGFALILFLLTKSGMIVVGGTGLNIIIISMMGLIAGWIVVAYAIIGGCLALLLGRRG